MPRAKPPRPPRLIIGMLQTLLARTIPAALNLIAWGSRTRLRAALLVALVALAAFLPGYAGMPPTDRDEGRYVMATRQMVATGDYVDIRNQDLPRHKQPAGIYWMQAAAVHLSGQGDGASIGVYRVPSLVGAVGGAVLTWWAFFPLIGRRAALLAGALMGATLLLGVEARIAKTDAMLLATTMAALGVLVRAFLDPVKLGAGRLGYLFWAALGLGSMIKGPIPLLVVLVATLALCGLARGVRWLGALRPWPGVLLLLAIALPWYVAIMFRTDGAFFANALGWNALGKVADAHQGHGGPPGFYLALVWITFWPASSFLAALLPWIWAQRRRREVLVLLCLILPIWVVFEAVATKLPHYVLPTYPALAALVALGVTEAGALVKGWFSRIVVQGLWLMPAVLLLVGGGAFIWFEGWLPILPTLALLGAVGLGVLAVVVAQRSAMATVPVAVAGALFTWLGTYPMLAQLDHIWLSPRMTEAIRAHAPCPDPMIVSAGYSEPSFVFLTRTDTLLAGGADAADFLAAGGCRVAFVDAAPRRRGRPPEEAAFLERLQALGLRAERLTMIEGRNMNGGHLRQMVLWRLGSAP